MPLTSAQNPLLQEIRRAVLSGRATEDGLIAAEGPHMLTEALNSGWKIARVICSVSGLKRQNSLVAEASSHYIPVTLAADRAFAAISDTGQNQGIVALLEPRSFSYTELLAGAGPVVILDQIQDPGNAGTILRSIEAFGGCGAVFTEGCVKIANGKLLRAAAGSLFRLPFVENVSASKIIVELKTAQRSIFSLTASGAKTLSDISLDGSVAFVVGSEGNGVSHIFIEVSQRITIRTLGVESLNAATACSIALYEAARQSSLKPGASH